MDPPRPPGRIATGNRPQPDGSIVRHLPPLFLSPAFARSGGLTPEREDVSPRSGIERKRRKRAAKVPPRAPPNRAHVKRGSRWHAVLVVGALCSLVLAPSSSGADLASVAVGNGYFSPNVLLVDPGTTVEFGWLEGRHRIAASQTAFWDSGERATPATYRVGFAEGTVRYRCTLHSTLDASQHCNGMCGILTDDPHLDTRQPTALILRPRRGEVVAPVPDVDAERSNIRIPVVIEGSAWDDVGVAAVAVRFWDNAGRSFERLADCAACAAPSVGWRVDVSLLPGSYLIEAAAADAAGNRYLTARQTFIVV